MDYGNMDRTLGPGPRLKRTGNNWTGEKHLWKKPKSGREQWAMGSGGNWNRWERERGRGGGSKYNLQRGPRGLSVPARREGGPRGTAGRAWPSPRGRSGPAGTSVLLITPRGEIGKGWQTVWAKEHGIAMERDTKKDREGWPPN